MASSISTIVKSSLAPSKVAARQWASNLYIARACEVCGVESQMKTAQKSHVCAIPARFDALPLLHRGKGQSGKNGTETVDYHCAGGVTRCGIRHRNCVLVPLYPATGP